MAAWSTARGGSTPLQLASYPLLPRARWPDAVIIALSTLMLCASPRQRGPAFLLAVSAAMATCSLPHPTALAGPKAARPMAVWDGPWLWLWLWLLLWVQVWAPAWPPAQLGLSAVARLAAAAATACLAATCCHVAWQNAVWRRCRSKAKPKAACQWLDEQQPKASKQQKQRGKEKEQEEEQQQQQQWQLAQVQQAQLPLPLHDAVSYQGRAGCRCLAVKVRQVLLYLILHLVLYMVLHGGAASTHTLACRLALHTPTHTCSAACGDSRFPRSVQALQSGV